MSYSITESCIGCGLCKKSCPVFAIKGEPKQLHQINSKRCVDCGVCGNVCPAKSVLNSQGEVTTKLPKDQWLKPFINRTHCSACGICIDICGFDCLEMSKPSFKGDLEVRPFLADESECVGCRLCAEACPLQVISMRKAVTA